MFYTNFQKIVKEVFPNSFHEASLTLRPKPDENITRKLEINTHLEHGHKKKIQAKFSISTAAVYQRKNQSQ